MPKAESACSRTPVEIWKEVFQYFLGPSLSNPRHSNVQDYQRHLFADGPVLQRSYIQRERNRNTLRLVSRNWKLVADLVADQIVFMDESRGQKPPNISLAHSKHIYYHYNPDMPPLKLDEDARLAQIVQVGRRDIIFPGHPTTLSQDDVLAFSWKPPPQPRWFEKLAHESLRSLVALSLSLHPSPGSTEGTALYLPMLRYLHIYTWGCDAKYLTQWYFPVLRYLSLQFVAESTASVGELLHRHSATIEELELSGDGDALTYCSSGLPRLKIYITAQFSTFGHALSQLDDMLGRATGSNASSDDHLVIQLLGLEFSLYTQSFLTSLPQRVRKMKKNIHFQIWESWEELTKEVEGSGNRVLVFYEMIKMLRSVPDLVFDSKGISWRTEAARRFESAVLAVVDV